MLFYRGLRRIAFLYAKLTARWTDNYYIALDVPTPKLTSHTTFGDRFVDFANKPGFRVLEIGSREVTGLSKLRNSIDKAEYIGFDYYPGKNVDVVGDAHRLSSYFDRKFDAIFSSAVFEHLAMPWIVAEEISKLLNVGGIVFIETHFSYSSHERPWHFFQFSDMALKALFSSVTGFECIEASMQNPIVGRFSHFADSYLRYQPIKSLYCHSSYIGKKVATIENFNWRGSDLDEITGSTKYPSPVDTSPLGV